MTYISRTIMFLEDAAREYGWAKKSRAARSTGTPPQAKAGARSAERVAQIVKDAPRPPIGEPAKRPFSGPRPELSHDELHGHIATLANDDAHPDAVKAAGHAVTHHYAGVIHNRLKAHINKKGFGAATPDKFRSTAGTLHTGRLTQTDPSVAEKGSGLRDIAKDYLRDIPKERHSAKMFGGVIRQRLEGALRRGRGRFVDRREALKGIGRKNIRRARGQNFKRHS